MSRVLIIEDEESIRRLIAYDLKVSGYQVNQASNGLDGLQEALKQPYDVILIDWMLPGLDGLSIVRELRSKDIDSILIMLTAKDEETDILECFEAGIDDYITKPFSPRQLQARIKAHLKRFNPNSPKLEVLNEVTINRNLYEVRVNDDVINLTKKEYDLFIYLVDHKNHVLSREQILNEIWNFDYDGDTRIVDVHIFKLRNKLETSSLVIESMRGVGYVLKV